MFITTETIDMLTTNNNDSWLFWIVVAAFIIAFFLAFGVGANDVANSFGTSVGSKVLTLRQACILATIFEILGAILLGYKVSSTIRTAMIQIDFFEPKELMLGYLAALFGSSVWNLMATLFSLPVSGTHSIVGAIIGFAIVGSGFNSVKWNGLGKIVLSWFVSPLLSGLVSMFLYLFIKWFVVSKSDSAKRGLQVLPYFYGITVLINVFSIFHEGPLFKYLNSYLSIVVALISGLVVAFFVRIMYVPKLRVKIKELVASSITPTKDHHSKSENINMSSLLTSTTDGNIKSYGLQMPSTPQSNATGKQSTDEKTPTTMTTTNLCEDNDKPEVFILFSFLQILTACFASFAHGANDVSNAIGPLVAIMMIYKTGGQSDETPWYILLYGGFAISVGLWVLGRRVIKTMGEDLTKITPLTGYTIETGSAITVLLASKIGLPISTTHCKVGSVIMVGKAMHSKKGVNWHLFSNILLAWLLTVPLSAIFSGCAMYLLKFFS